MTYTTFHGAVATIAHAMPEQIAYRTPLRTLRFADVERETNRIANGLVTLGIGKGDRVACLTRHMAECTLLVIAAQKVGAVCMPVNWRLAPSEVEYIVNHGEAVFLMADGEFLPLLDKVALPRVRKTLTTLPGANRESLAEWNSEFEDASPVYQAGLQDVALQLYSSGTTGLPKGVELSHRNLIGVCETVRGLFGYGKRPTVTLNVAPTFHIGGLGLSFVVLYNGGASVTYPEFVPAQVVAAFTQHRVTHSFLVPAMIHALLQVPSVEKTDFSALRVIGYGAAPISETVLSEALRLFRCKFVQNYGLTETTGAVVALTPEDHDPNGPRAFLLRAAGKACAGVELRIVDIATGENLPDGQIGEVWIRSPQNMIGYWHNEKATREAYPEGKVDGVGWFRTGDAGSLRDGYLFIEDRIKDMIISGGENIYPVEVENVLMKHPLVLDCAVIAVPDEKWGEAVKACVIPRPGARLEEAEVIDFCRERLAHFKCPRSVDVMDSLPRNPSGKLLKNLLRKPYWEGKTRNVN
ncbi:long-chain-fatty-acid--CoA ligase [Noviherbaspirillum pedocola]|uniref:Long-chain-fatty-acid--CoA ligase n=1 Tax=Noviherbaspirillum pedocola TaxID=2801341 RepID=A0A934SXL1_9BURK|nr:long-chain-fatty-acid--CoA ligase [Noviherbaspirillum pedocola]MBK4738706.1 long-chain-fatty-acid--CoA ligase [Noviherbaspirillum pedocola]